ncbi:MAG: hypothetical protein J7K85_05085 [Anaerolineaceae bacterium]|nr:hypothetical protein [Anaerolineaceae bacterium]
MRTQTLRKVAAPFLLILLVSACSSAEKTTSPAPTAEVIPTAEPTATQTPTQTSTPSHTQDWTGTWFLWVGNTYQAIKVNFTAEGNQIIGIIEGEEESRKINAMMSLDGITVIGDWESSSGNTGLIAMLISKDRQEFVGNFGDEIAFCGSREGTFKPTPCFAEIGGWGGEWVVWFGPEETEAILFFKQKGSDIDVMVYDFDGTVSEDGSTLTGEFNELGISGSLEAKILDNMAQFTGNMSNLFPFCGVRRGGPKPAVCLGP